MSKRFSPNCNVPFSQNTVRNCLLHYYYLQQQRSILEDVAQEWSKENCPTSLKDRISNLKIDLANFIRLLETRRKELRDVSDFIATANSVYVIICDSKKG